jgi:hypothetical protein
MNRPLPVLIILCTVFFSALAGTFAWAANNQVTRTLDVDLGNVDALVIDGGVGTMDIVPVPGTTLRIEVEIEGNRTGLLRRKRDVTDIALAQHLDNGELSIELTEDDFDDLEVHWIIEMPAVATTSLNLAVGQLIARVGATALDVNVGVGQAAVTAARMDTGHIEASAGVGSATLHGVNRSDSQRAFVSENAEGFGDGAFDMEVNVGVGEAAVFLVDET